MWQAFGLDFVCGSQREKASIPPVADANPGMTPRGFKSLSVRRDEIIREEHEKLRLKEEFEQELVRKHAKDLQHQRDLAAAQEAREAQLRSLDAETQRRYMAKKSEEAKKAEHDAIKLEAYEEIKARSYCDREAPARERHKRQAIMEAEARAALAREEEERWARHRYARQQQSVVDATRAYTIQQEEEEQRRHLALFKRSDWDREEADREDKEARVAAQQREIDDHLERLIQARNVDDMRKAESRKAHEDEQQKIQDYHIRAAAENAYLEEARRYARETRVSNYQSADPRHLP